LLLRTTVSVVSLTPLPHCSAATVMNTRGLIELIALNVGRKLLFTPCHFSIMVFMTSITTSTPTPLMDSIGGKTQHS
jgi:hypothetical protein